MRVIGCRNGALGRIGPLGPTWSRGRLTWPRGYGTANTTRARPQGRAHRLRYRPVFDRHRKRSASDRAGLEARGADVHPLVSAFNHNAHALDVRVPPPVGLLLRPGDVVSETGALAADVTDSSHWEISLFGVGATRTPTQSMGSRVPGELKGLPWELDKLIRSSDQNPNPMRWAAPAAIGRCPSSRTTWERPHAPGSENHPHTTMMAGTIMGRRR